MGRWEPDARGRLLNAALELFAEQGYDATTAAQIAEHAGLTKTTLFRHFADKREILFQGQPELVSVVAAGVGAAADDATPLERLRAGIAALCEAHVPEQQEIGRRIEKLVDVTPELQERTAFKRSTLNAALEAALVAAMGDRRLAGALADLGIRAYYDGFWAWTDVRRTDALADVVFEELDALDGALRSVLTPA
jgi:AcrR family transcriptional regulator